MNARRLAALTLIAVGSIGSLAGMGWGIATQQRIIALGSAGVLWIMAILLGVELRNARTP